MSDEFFSLDAVRRFRPMTVFRPACEACGLYAGGCKSPKMRVSGEGRRRVLICSDYPGKEEDNVGEPMVGRAGQLLERKCAAFGVDLRRDCWLTNALICYDTTADRDDKKKHKRVTDCRPNLLNVIRELDPITVILLGGFAVQSLIGHVWEPNPGDIGLWVGRQIPNHKPNVWICPSWNPAHLLYKKDKLPALESVFSEHLESAFALTDKPWPNGPPDYPSRVQVLLDADEAAACLRRYKTGLIAFDYETTTKKPDSPQSEIVCCSVCYNGAETIAFPWHGEAKREMIRLLQNRDVGKISHNLSFEDQWTRSKCGVEVMGWFWDSMNNAHAIDPRGSGGTNLGFQAFVRLGVPEWYSHVEPYLHSSKPGGYAVNRIREVSPLVIMKYCGMDSLTSYDLTGVQRRELGLPMT